jgi:hypothetical protein
MSNSLGFDIFTKVYGSPQAGPPRCQRHHLPFADGN